MSDLAKLIGRREELRDSLNAWKQQLRRIRSNITSAYTEDEILAGMAADERELAATKRQIAKLL